MAENFRVPIKRLKLDNDRDFVNNLEQNYRICEEAKDVKQQLANAVRKGKTPERLWETLVLCMAAEQIKDYMDKRRALMKNSYYLLLERKHTDSLSDGELRKKANSESNPKLKEYYRMLLELRESEQGTLPDVGAFVKELSKFYTKRDAKSWANEVSRK